VIDGDTQEIVKPHLKGGEQLFWAQSVSQATQEKEAGFLSRLFKKPPNFKDPIHYAITDRRLLAFNADGNLDDEMNVQDMEHFVDLGSPTEFMVSRINDPDSEKGFHFYRPDNQAAAKEILFSKFGLK